MTPEAQAHRWSEQTLFAKAKLYAEQMQRHPVDHWEFGFWSTLCLEMLGRAALAHISPILLADNKTWENLAYALGTTVTTKKFSPTSLPTRQVFTRLGKLSPDFSDEIQGICAEHVDRRNRELHSGEFVFVDLGSSQWLARFYLACKVILGTMDKTLDDILSEAEDAEDMITAYRDKAAGRVQRDIRCHRRDWSNKSPKERKGAILEANTWATRQIGHRVKCPSCSSQAILKGKPAGEVQTTVIENEIEQRQSQIPSSFECVACGLKITGLSKLSACGLGDAFSGTTTYTASEYFELYTQDELDEAVSNLYEEDFNE